VTPLAADAESADPFMHASMLACAGDGQGPLSLNRTPVALVPGCPGQARPRLPPARGTGRPYALSRAAQVRKKCHRRAWPFGLGRRD
jgi:hypothetical protein